MHAGFWYAAFPDGQQITAMLASNGPRGERTAPVASTDKRDISLAVIVRTDHRSRRPPSHVAVFVGWSMALPNSFLAPPDYRAKLDPSPRLIAADAALTLLQRWSPELNVLRRRSPASDAAKTLADCIEELTAAIAAGQAVTIQITVSEAHALSHIPVSTLRWLCNRKPELVGARKHEGIWYVDRSRFERYLASSNGGTTAVGVGRQLPPPAVEGRIPQMGVSRAHVGSERE